MILRKTGIEKMPETCMDCPDWCRLPCKKSATEMALKTQYLTKRHKDCPLVEVDDADLPDLVSKRQK